MKIEARLVKCSDSSPENDGYYTVVRTYSGNVHFAGEMSFTVEGGWNTSRSNGKLSADHRIMYETEECAYWVKEFVITEGDDE